jgi:hypothetical protein
VTSKHMQFDWSGPDSVPSCIALTTFASGQTCATCPRVGNVDARKKSAMGQELRSSRSRRRVATDETAYGWRGDQFLTSSSLTLGLLRVGCYSPSETS